TRQFGLKIYVDVEILVDENLSLLKAHEIAEGIHDEIEQNIPEVIHCMVHVNPGKKA
ncbi:MAG: cation transporter dimerization domain-containing protein, partial [Bacilli bacterium]|nr:cation transporter dimerization domain-containing protein [Bacilli bacterium]